MTASHKNQLPFTSIASTTIELLEYIKNITNTRTITKKKNYNKNKHKGSYTLITIYDAAINLLK